MSCVDVPMQWEVKFSVGPRLMLEDCSLIFEVEGADLEHCGLLSEGNRMLACKPGVVAVAFCQSQQKHNKACASACITLRISHKLYLIEVRAWFVFVQKSWWLSTTAWFPYWNLREQSILSGFRFEFDLFHLQKKNYHTLTTSDPVPGIAWHVLIRFDGFSLPDLWGKCYVHRPWRQTAPRSRLHSTAKSKIWCISWRPWCTSATCAARWWTMSRWALHILVFLKVKHQCPLSLFAFACKLQFQCWHKCMHVGDFNSGRFLCKLLDRVLYYPVQLDVLNSSLISVL